MRYDWLFRGGVTLFMAFMGLSLAVKGGLKKLAGDDVPPWVAFAGIVLLFLFAGYCFYLGFYGERDVTENGSRESIEEAAARRAERDAERPKVTGRILKTKKPPPTPTKITGTPTRSRDDSEV